MGTTIEEYFGGNHFDLDSFTVEFWDEKRIEPNSLYSVEIHIAHFG